MAVKDTEPYLKDCLDSILRQTYRNWELIAVNDHSTDRSAEILKEYSAKDDRIRVFQATGQKLIPALQDAFRESRGLLINRMDSDDKMPEYKLSVLVEEWQKHGKGTVVAGGTEHFVDQGEVGGGFRRYEAWLNQVAREGRHWQEIYTECTIPSHSWMMHREDLEVAGAFDPLVYPEDYDLSFRLYRSGLRVAGLDKVLHFWRDRDNRISRTWEVYEDNRYFDLKVRYFYELDRDKDRPLVLWGGGRNGKDFARLLMEKERDFYWMTGNENKVGKDIYGIILEHESGIPEIQNPQILIVVGSPKEKESILRQLSDWEKEAVKDYWFFL